MGVPIGTKHVGYVQRRNLEVQQHGYKFFCPLSTNATETRLAGVGEVGSHGVGNLEHEE